MANFLVDEQLPSALASAIIALGHGAITVSQAGLRGAPDDEVLEYARQNGAVLVTSDRGFGNIRTYPLGSHAGIILLRLEPRIAYPRIIHRLIAVLAGLSVDRLTGALCVISPTTVWIRRFR